MKPRPPAAIRDLAPRPGRYFRLTYSNAAPDDEPKLFQGRDGIAFSELSAALPALGYQFGTTIHFYPDEETKLKDFPAFAPGDLLVLPTRPPPTDREALFPPRKIIRNSKNDLKKLIFKELFVHFAHCTRRHIKLTPEAKKTLKRDADKWAFLEFFEHAGENHRVGQAHIRKYAATGRKPEKHQTPPPSSSWSAPPAWRAWTAPPASRAASWPASAWTAIPPSSGAASCATNSRNGSPNRASSWPSCGSSSPSPAAPLTPEFATDPAYVEVNVLTQT